MARSVMIAGTQVGLQLDGAVTWCGVENLHGWHSSRARERETLHEVETGFLGGKDRGGQNI